MSNQSNYIIKNNKKIADKVYEMILEGDTSKIKNSGQFINIQIEGLFLRRPISICDYDGTSITIIYKVVGKGTIKMSQYQVGQELDCLVGLGNGFEINRGSKSTVLVGGGVGVPPMYHLAKQLVKNNINVKVVLGFTTKTDVFYEEEFKALGVEVLISTNDGSYGTQGYVTNILNDLDFDYYYSCGPQPMLLSLLKYEANGQLSFEERMGCGFGACMGCSCKTITGYKRICKEGPVLLSSEVLINE